MNFNLIHHARNNPPLIRVLKLLFISAFFLLGGKVHAQFYAVNTDLAGFATGTLNAGASAAIGLKWSFHVPVHYNPWTFGGDSNKKFKQLTVQPGVRYWFDQSYGYGWFVGVNAVVSRFNVSGLFGSDYRYDGMAYGGGISGGLSLRLAKFWNLEFELGAGGVYSSHSKYKCERCGEKLSDEKGFYFVPTKIAVNLVYLF